MELSMDCMDFTARVVEQREGWKLAKPGSHNAWMKAKVPMIAILGHSERDMSRHGGLRSRYVYLDKL